MSSYSPVFLSFEQVEDIHRESLVKYGGTDGIRDRGQIESALGSAQNTFCYTEDLFQTAAAYAYNIAENQAFLDGNKRTAIASAIVFLKLNGYTCPQNTGALYDAMIAIANKQLSKAGLADLFRQLCNTG